jgi:PHD/YefM family antitoxin component YafN of YafNO toxin-antitoxin module
MREVVETQEPVIVERAGRRQIVLMSVSEYERLCADRSSAPGWKELVAQAREQIRRDLRGRKLPPAEDVIREMREERDAHLDEVVRELRERQDARPVDLR